MNELFYLLACVFLILGLKQMSSPRHAWRGFLLASVGVLVAVLLTLVPSLMNFKLNTVLILIAVISASLIATRSAQTVKMIQMPQMIAFIMRWGVQLLH